MIQACVQVHSCSKGSKGCVDSGEALIKPGRKQRCVQVCVNSLAVLEGSLWPPPLLSDCSLRGALALLFRAVIGQVPPAELVCSSFVAPRFRSLLKASLWRDAASAASPSSFTLLRPRAHTALFATSPDLAITSYN